MLKLNSIISRRKDLDLAAFSQHWRTVHRELALRLVAPGIMRGYVQNHRQEEGLEDLPIVGDGVPELWVTMAEDIIRLGTCPEYMEGAYLDEPNFMEGRAENVISELTLIAGPQDRKAAAGLPKLMLFTKRHEGVNDADFAAWCDAPRPLLMPDASPVRLERQLAVAKLPEGLTSAYDMVECSWWPDMEALRAAWKARSTENAARFIDVSALAGLVVREEPVLWPEYL